MAFNLEPIAINIELNQKGLTGALKSVEKQSNRSVQKVDRDFSKLNKTLSRVAKALAGLFAVRVLKSFLEAGSALESVRISLEGLLGSAEAANAAFDTIEGLAVDVKQNINELSNAFVVLQTASLASAKNLEIVANVATVMNTSMVNVATALRTLETETLRNNFGFQQVSVAAGNFFAITQSGEKIVAESRAEFQRNILAFFEFSRIAGSARKAADTFGSGLSTIKTSLSLLSESLRRALGPALKELSRSFRESILSVIRFI